MEILEEDDDAKNNITSVWCVIACEHRTSFMCLCAFCGFVGGGVQRLLALDPLHAVHVASY